MDDDARFDEMAEACLKAHEAVVETGTPAMLTMTRALLWQIGQELARRTANQEKALMYENSQQQDGRR